MYTLPENAIEIVHQIWYRSVILLLSDYRPVVNMVN